MTVLKHFIQIQSIILPIMSKLIISAFFACTIMASGPQEISELKEEIELMLKDKYQYEGGPIDSHYQLTSDEFLEGLKNFKEALENTSETVSFQLVQSIFISKKHTVGVQVFGVYGFSGTYLTLHIPIKMPGDLLIPDMISKISRRQEEKNVLDILRQQYGYNGIGLTLLDNIGNESLMIEKLQELQNALLNTPPSISFKDVSNITFHNRNDMSVSYSYSSNRLIFNLSIHKPVQTLLSFIKGKIVAYNAFLEEMKQLVQKFRDVCNYEGSPLIKAGFNVYHDELAEGITRISKSLEHVSALPSCKKIKEIKLVNKDVVDIQSSNVTGLLDLALPLDMSDDLIAEALEQELSTFYILEEINHILTSKYHYNVGHPLRRLRNIDKNEFNHFLKNFKDILEREENPPNFSHVDYFYVTDSDHVRVQIYTDETATVYLSTNLSSRFLIPIIRAKTKSLRALELAVNQKLESLGHQGPPIRNQDLFEVREDEYREGLEILLVSLETAHFLPNFEGVGHIWITNGPGKLYVYPDSHDGRFIISIPERISYESLMPIMSVELSQLSNQVYSILNNHHYDGILSSSLGANDEDIAVVLEKLWVAFSETKTLPSLEKVGRIFVVPQGSPQWAFRYSDSVNLYIPVDTSANTIIPFIVESLSQ